MILEDEIRVEKDLHGDSLWIANNIITLTATKYLLLIARLYKSQPEN